MTEIEERDETAKLWVQYIRMITTAKEFARSEKMSNLKIQFQVIQKMLPYFYATTHFKYTKLTLLYVQSICKNSNSIKAMERFAIPMKLPLQIFYS